MSEVLRRTAIYYTSKLQPQVMGVLHRLLITVSDLLARALVGESQLTSLAMMVPRRSISTVIGMGLERQSGRKLKSVTIAA